MDTDIKNPQDALEWIERRIHEEAKADGEMTNEHAIQLAFIQNVLAKFPRRNCDIGTAEEQEKRFHDFCRARNLPRMEGSSYCAYKCPLEGDTCCELAWAQMPYVEKEGGAK